MDDKKKSRLEEEAYVAAQALTKLEVPQIEERIFLEVYLPLMLDETQDRLYIWLNVAGTPYRRVDIMRDGVKVGEVPPLWSPIDTRIPRNGEQSMYERVANIYNEAKRLPGRGGKYVVDRLRTLMPENNSVDNVSNQWKELIKKYAPWYYDIDPVESPEQEADKAVVNNEIGEDFEEL